LVYRALRMRHKFTGQLNVGLGNGLHLGLRKVKRPLQTIGCSGRLTTVTLPILTRSRPWLSCVRVILKTVAEQYSVT